MMKPQKHFKRLVLAVVFSLAPFCLSLAGDFEQVLQATLQNNPAIKGKQAEVNAQEFSLESAKGKRFPTLSAEINNVAENYDQGVARIDQPLYAFGKIDNAIETAQQGVSVENLALLQVQRQLIEKAAVAYARIEGVNQLIEVASDNITEHEKLLEHIQRRYQGQMASEADLTLGKSRLVLARSGKQRLMGELSNAITELKALTIETLPTTASTPKAFAQLPATEDIYAKAMESHADLRFKREKAKQVKLQMDGAKLAAMPDLKLRGEYEFLDTPTNSDDRGRIGLVLTGSLEGFGLVYSNRGKAAEASYRAALDDVDLTKSEVQRDIATLIQNRQVTQSLIASQQEAVATVEETYASYFRLYKSGYKSWIDVLNIQRELNDQRQQLVQLNNQWLQSTLQIGAKIGLLDQASSL